MSYVNINNRYMTDNKLGDLGLFGQHDFRQGEWTDFKAIYLEKLARFYVSHSDFWSMMKANAPWMALGGIGLAFKILTNPVVSAKRWIATHWIKDVEWDRTVMPAVRIRINEIKAELLAEKERIEEEKKYKTGQHPGEINMPPGSKPFSGETGTYGTPAGLLPSQQQTYGQMMPTGAPKKGIDTTMLLLIAAGVIVVGGAFVMMTRKKK